MVALGMDLSDDSLIDTPTRVAKMYVNEIFQGLDYNKFPKCTTVQNKMNYDEMVIEKGITAISSCEHHFVTIDQKVAIAYIPKDKVLGLSKLNRVSKFFAQRPQIQERYAEQVFHALEYILGTEDIAVVVRGKHYCVAQRGVEDSSSLTITSKLGGVFKSDSAVRKEFMDLVNGN
jgi:GTP cyclohydrolase I